MAIFAAIITGAALFYSCGIALCLVLMVGFWLGSRLVHRQQKAPRGRSTGLSVARISNDAGRTVEAAGRLA